MDLDDALAFRAWQKLWIYFVACGILMLATFIISICWDRVSPVIHGGGQRPPSLPAGSSLGAMAMEDDDIGETSTKNLEPGSVPDPPFEEFLERILSKRTFETNHAQGGDLEEEEQ